MSAESTMVLLALMVCFALVGAAVAERLRLPRIMGWIMAGLALKWALIGLGHAGLASAGKLLHVSQAAATSAAGGLAEGPESLQFVKRLALTVVMFSIGTAFELHHLRRLGKTFLWVGLAQSIGALVLVFGACAAVGLLAGTEAPLLTAAFLAAIAVAVSPAATLLTLRQYEAKGYATEDILTITGLSAVIAIFLFDFSLLVFVEVGWVQPPGGAAGIHLAVLKLLAATAGSVLAGVAAGMVLSLLHARSSGGQATVALLAVILGILALSGPLNLDYLLISLVAGVTFINLAPDPGMLEQRLAVVGAPLFALLFVIAGYGMRFEAFGQPAMAALIGAYIVARVVGKLSGAYLAARRLGQAEVQPGIGAGLLCQGDVAFALVASLEGLWSAGGHPAWVGQIQAGVLGAIATFELAGPLLLKRTVVRAGEVKAVRLLHFSPPGQGALSQLKDGLLSLLRRLGILPLPGAAEGPLRARHVMRTNVKVLQAGATIDEVLHFIERSRLDHFPVVDGEKRFVGTISLADVRDIIYQPELHDLVTAQDLLEDELVTADPDETLEELFEKLTAHKARDLIVLEQANGRVMGIVEQRDVLRAMHVQQTGQYPPAQD